MKALLLAILLLPISAFAGPFYSLTPEQRTEELCFDVYQYVLPRIAQWKWVTQLTEDQVLSFPLNPQISPWKAQLVHRLIEDAYDYDGDGADWVERTFKACMGDES